MYVTSKAKPEVWVAGKEVQSQIGQLESGRIADPNLTIWKIVLPDSLVNSETVTLKIEQLPGFHGGAAIPEPIVFECGKGKIQLGDLSDNESLRTYSGGMLYGKTIHINAKQANSNQIILDLGKVVGFGLKFS